jgi:hypothetical protein
MSLINKMIDNIKNNQYIKIGVAAVLLHGTKPIGDVCNNTTRNYFRGTICPSLHAEANAVMTYFGKHISYSPKHGWRTSYIKKPKEFKYNGG